MNDTFGLIRAIQPVLVTHHLPQTTQGGDGRAGPGRLSSGAMDAAAWKGMITSTGLKELAFILATSHGVQRGLSPRGNPLLAASPARNTHVWDVWARVTHQQVSVVPC